MEDNNGHGVTPFGSALKTAVVSLRKYPPLLLGLAGAMVLGATAALRPSDLRTVATAIVIVLALSLLAWAAAERRKTLGSLTTLRVWVGNRIKTATVYSGARTKAWFGFFNQVDDLTVGKPGKK